MARHVVAGAVVVQARHLGWRRHGPAKSPAEDRDEGPEHAPLLLDPCSGSAMHRGHLGPCIARSTRTKHMQTKTQLLLHTIKVAIFGATEASKKLIIMN